MTLEGFGTEQIATQFEKEGILTPQAYWIQKGIGRPGRSKMQKRSTVYGNSGSAFTTTAWAPSRFQAHFLCRHPMCR